MLEKVERLLAFSVSFPPSAGVWFIFFNLWLDVIVYIVTVERNFSSCFLVVTISRKAVGER